jgi:hypothetical protein
MEDGVKISREISNCMKDWDFLSIKSIDRSEELITGWRKHTMSLTSSIFIDSRIGAELTSFKPVEVFFVENIYRSYENMVFYWEALFANVSLRRHCQCFMETCTRDLAKASTNKAYQERKRNSIW